MGVEPGRSEIFLTGLAFCFYGKSVYQTFADRLPLRGDERVLDFGCGMGTVAGYVAKRLTGGRLTCMDISQRWLSRCRKTLRGCSNVDFLCREAKDLEPGSFDVVYCHFVLHDIPERELETVVPALATSLKAGGTFVLKEPLAASEKLNRVKALLMQTGMSQKCSRITDVPLMGTAIESTYTKESEVL